MFIWDESKREQVIKEHKDDFAKIGDVFDDAYAIDFVDEAHSTENETRYDIIGKLPDTVWSFWFMQRNPKQTLSLLLAAERSLGW